VFVNAEDSSGNAVEISSVDSVRLRNVNVLLPQGHGFNLTNCNNVDALDCSSISNRGAGVHGFLAQGCDGVRVRGGAFKKSSGNGIHLGSSASTVSNALVDGVDLIDNVLVGVRLAQTVGSRVVNSRFSGNASGIVEATGTDHSLIAHNDLRNQATTKVTIVGTNSRVRDNLGYATQSSGTVQVASGATGITVTHGLSRTPTARDVMVTSISSGGNMTRFWVTIPNSSVFTIMTDQNPGAAGALFAWSADILQAV
jgi:hypothetical protein